MGGNNTGSGGPAHSQRLSRASQGTTVTRAGSLSPARQKQLDQVRKEKRVKMALKGNRVSGFIPLQLTKFFRRRLNLGLKNSLYVKGVNPVLMEFKECICLMHAKAELPQAALLFPVR